MVTEIELLMNRRIEAGERFGRTVTDGLIAIDSVRYHLEADHSGKETRRQWEQKLSRFPEQADGPREFVLVVAASEPRKRRLVEWSASRQGFLLFASIDGLRRGEPWVDRAGRAVRI